MINMQTLVNKTNTTIGELDGKMNEIMNSENPSQQDLLKLQQMMNQMNMLVQMTSQLQKSYKDMMESVIQRS